MKYAPKKVFILENGNYKEISYEALCYLTEESAQYADKLFIPLHGMLMEVTKDIYKDFYKDKRRQKYLYEQSEENGDISYDMLTTEEFNGEDILIDSSEDIAVQVENKIMADKLKSSLSFLSKDEQRLIYALFFEGMTEREYAIKEGVYRNAIHKRKVRILNKLKILIENKF